MSPLNVVVFGESGHGKSSLINMIIEEIRATISSSAKSCTFEAKSYPHRILEHDFVFWDTRGFNEGEQGAAPDFQAAGQLYGLLRKLKDGVSLLIFCIRAPRINDVAKRNWDLFRDVICQDKVNTVIVVTHLEAEDSMDEWWKSNISRFMRYRICPTYINDDEPGVACITASKGKMKNGRYTFQEEYDESRAKVRRLVVDFHMPTPWKVESVEWFRTTTKWCRRTKGPGHGVSEIMLKWGVPEEEAMRLAKVLDENSA
jgi:GTPase Era involved in 16S rRNA processing